MNFTIIKNSNSVSVGIAIYLAILMLGSSASAIAEEDYEDRLEATNTKFGDAEELLDELRNMRFSGAVPSLNGFSTAKKIKLAAPTGSTVYTTAYKSKSNCVVFFAPLGKNERNLAVKWDGAKCNGKPIQGTGSLQIVHMLDTPAGVYRRMYIYYGNFNNGMLTGEGERTNLLFNPDGEVVDDTYEFSGEFSYGMLNGAGKRTWTGPSGNEPSAWVQEGTFKDGTPSGLITYSRLHPFMGVEADSSEMVLNAKAEAYTYQWYNNGKNPVLGVMYFYGDQAQWQIFTYEIKGNVPQHADVTRINGSTILLANCADWDIQQGRWSCSKGAAAFTVSPNPGRTVDGGFEIPIPFKTSGGSIRRHDGSRVLIGSFDNRYEMSCNEDISLCHGKNIVGLYANLFIWGESEFRNEDLIPVSGTLYRTSDPFTYDLSKDNEKVAVCEAFSSPTRCSRGTLFEDVTWTGGYILGGLKYSTSDGYVFGNPADMGLKPDGKGQYKFSDGKWVEGYMQAGEWTSVGECDNPNSSKNFTCRLRGNTVVFTSH